MKQYFNKKNEEIEENIFWVTMSDLLLGLMITFILLFVLAILDFSSDKIEKQQKNMETMEKINEKLAEKNLNIEIDKLANIVKVSDLELFESNSWELTPDGKTFLDNFLPSYFDVLLSDENIANKISQIVIEGHTDSNSFHYAKNEKDNYNLNLELSAKRALSVSKYILSKSYNEKIDKNLYKKISINGRSYSNPVLNDDGSENFAKSRRVEFKIIYNEPSYIESIIGKGR